MNSRQNSRPSDVENAALGPPAPTLRAVGGGVLMGLANLVPGISGGTMLLAAGIYTEFIDSVADLTRLRRSRRSLMLVLTVAAAAALAIALLAGPVKDLVVHHRWIMYSLFIGLTLGGVPALWRMARPASPRLTAGVAAGFIGMALLAVAQINYSAGGAAADGNPVMLFIAGLAGAASMILPGISGGYLLLVLGQYVPILTAIETAVTALSEGDLSTVMGTSIAVFVPVALGMLVGVAGVSNTLRYLLAHHRAVTLGVLLGFLAGAVVGLWPFQQGVPPQPGSILRGRPVTAANAMDFDPEDWPLEFFRPTAGQAVGSVLLAAAGATATIAISRLGRD